LYFPHYNPDLKDTDQIFGKTWGPRGSITGIAEGDRVGDACDTCSGVRDYANDADCDGVDNACDECPRAIIGMFIYMIHGWVH
jgi:hypothetical protein